LKCHLCDFKCTFNSRLKQHLSVSHEKRKTIPMSYL
jgi:hypothetical protein